MSQWNNSYAYNNQYQQGANNWNGDMNGQFINQGYYARPEGGTQYVSFNEFLNQMQTSNPGASNAANYNNPQYETYPARQYNYQNMPSTSQTRPNNYNYSVPANIHNEVNTYQQNAPSQFNPPPESNSYTSNMILNSNLTATATEFVPKSVAQPSTSTLNITEAPISQNVVNEAQSSYHKKPRGSSSDKNWRERPQKQPPSEIKEKAVSNGYSQENVKGNSNNTRNRDTYRSNEGNGRLHEEKNQDSSNRDSESTPQTQESSYTNNESSSRNEASSHNQENNSRNYDNRSRKHESGNRNYESNSSFEPNSRNQDSHSRNPESQGRNYDKSSRGRKYESNNRNQEFNRNQELSNRNQDTNSRSYESNSRNERRNQAKSNSKFKGKDSDNLTFYNSTMPKDQEARGGRGEGNGRNKNWIGSQRLHGAERNVVEDEQYASHYTPQREEKFEKERAPRVQNIASPVRFKSKQGDQGMF